jgi:hypothetical protein
MRWFGPPPPPDKDPYHEAFWTQDCRGPALGHSHNDHVGEVGAPHMDCPCKDCGLTPNRWAEMLRIVDPASLSAELDDAPLQLPQPGELGVPIMEPGLAKGELRQYVGSGQYVDGNPKGPGRGLLSPAWVEWALKAEWKS